jgi:protein-tyrosine-phosphatase/DNA-binding transcriptional ArsR family regulator
VSGDASPPSFLRLAGHPLRWRLLLELARSDRQVRELCAVIGRPQSLVSYHLGRLRAEQVVSTRRSSADRRDAYYGLELARCGTLLTATGAALRPGLRLTPTPTGRGPRRSDRARPRVLFLCTGNSARSQMAQALVEHLTDGAIEASSAGTNPKPLHPNAVRAMREHGIDIAGRRPKHLSRLTDRRFDYVISLCDRVREVCLDRTLRPDAPQRDRERPGRPADPDRRHFGQPDRTLPTRRHLALIHRSAGRFRPTRNEE